MKALSSCMGWLERRTRPRRAEIWHAYDAVHHRGRRNRETLYAFYDLEVSPATFDILKFLVLAERERRIRECRDVHVVIVPGPNQGFREEDVEHYEVAQKSWRLRNVLLPCCSLLPTCRATTVCVSRGEAAAIHASLATHVFPDHYTVRHPISRYKEGALFETSGPGESLSYLQAPTEAVRRMQDLFDRHVGERRAVAITLREAAYYQDRNSSLVDWAQFANDLDSSVYCPIIVRDMDRAAEPLPAEFSGAVDFRHVIWNVELRAALYQLSHINLSVSNGPSMIAMLLCGAKSILVKMVTPSCPCATVAFLESQGWSIGEQVPWTGRYQRIVWEDDRFAVLRESFRELVEMVERDTAPSGARPESAAGPQTRA